MDQHSNYIRPSRYAMLPEWVLYHPDLKDSDVRVYGVMARMADCDGRAFPKAATVAEKLGVSDDTVRRSVARLEAVGAVRVEPKMGPNGFRSNDYFIAGDTPLTVEIHPARIEQREVGSASGRKSAESRRVRTVAESESADLQGRSPQICGDKEGEPSLNENQGNENQVPCPTAVELASSLDVEFDLFWNAYGYKAKRKDAVVAFRKARKKVSLDIILDALPAYNAHLQRTGYDKALPTSWLNAERWDDEYPISIAAKRSATPSTVDGIHTLLGGLDLIRGTGA